MPDTEVLSAGWRKDAGHRGFECRLEEGCRTPRVGIGVGGSK